MPPTLKYIPLSFQRLKLAWVFWGFENSLLLKSFEFPLRIILLVAAILSTYQISVFTVWKPAPKWREHKFTLHIHKSSQTRSFSNNCGQCKVQLLSFLTGLCLDGLPSFGCQLDNPDGGNREGAKGGLMWGAGCSGWGCAQLIGYYFWIWRLGSKASHGYFFSRGKAVPVHHEQVYLAFSRWLVHRLVENLKILGVRTLGLRTAMWTYFGSKIPGTQKTLAIGKKQNTSRAIHLWSP